MFTTTTSVSKHPTKLSTLGMYAFALGMTSSVFMLAAGRTFGYPRGTFELWGTLFLIGVAGLLLALASRPRVHIASGSAYRGRIESTLEEGPPLEVIWGRLHAVPFVVRLDDGRTAIVDDTALALETDARDQEIEVGAEIEIVGNPTLTPWAPAGYRGATVFRFTGEPSKPVGIRLCS